ncbi:hypothetical protein BJY59DRAFT_699434 [Rhodotorula toruloides]
MGRAEGEGEGGAGTEPAPVPSQRSQPAPALAPALFPSLPLLSSSSSSTRSSSAPTPFEAGGAGGVGVGGGGRVRASFAFPSATSASGPTSTSTTLPPAYFPPPPPPHAPHTPLSFPRPLPPNATFPTEASTSNSDSDSDISNHASTDPYAALAGPALEKARADFLAHDWAYRASGGSSADGNGEEGREKGRESDAEWVPEREEGGGGGNARGNKGRKRSGAEAGGGVVTEPASAYPLPLLSAFFCSYPHAQGSLTLELTLRSRTAHNPLDSLAPRVPPLHKPLPLPVPDPALNTPHFPTLVLRPSLHLPLFLSLEPKRERKRSLPLLFLIRETEHVPSRTLDAPIPVPLMRMRILVPTPLNLRRRRREGRVEETECVARPPRSVRGAGGGR